MAIYSGSCPAPFSALNGFRLGGPDGSHPLHRVAIPELVMPCSGAVAGEIRIDGPIMVGEAIRGHLLVVAQRDVEARGAVLRLVGLRLVEQRKSETHETGSGEHKVTTTESWVEANGSLFETLPFTEPAVPSTLRAGQTFECDFLLPAPRLGPPAAHLGEAIVAWALEARWDVAMGEDAWVAAALNVEQNPDLIRAGVGRQGGLSMLDAVSLAGGATIGVANDKPVRAGSVVRVSVEWPGAPDGDARIELHRRITAPNGVEGVLEFGGDHRRRPASGCHGRPRRPGCRLPALVRRGRAREQLRHPGAHRPSVPERPCHRAPDRRRLRCGPAAPSPEPPRQIVGGDAPCPYAARYLRSRYTSRAGQKTALGAART